ncbi:MAG: bacillithiol biosynthesis deacetylase BshB1 [Bdellovibrionales bacterium]|nr:bacillithiol biosynthesis deacetylase BshB1 [Bdellovibrionales bacterium]
MGAKKRVLVCAPHPDDAELGMGATISLLLDSGAEVAIVDLTNGEPTPYGTPEKRRLEWEEASRILGLSRRFQLGLTNREIFDGVEQRKLLAEVLREFRPEILFAPFWEDAHPDHWQATQLVDAARFYSKFVQSSMKGMPHFPRRTFYYFCTHLRPKVVPAFVVDVSGHFDRKIESVLAYKSQFIENEINATVVKQLEVEAAYWGRQIGVPYGEAFASREQIRFSSAQALLDS